MPGKEKHKLTTQEETMERPQYTAAIEAISKVHAGRGATLQQTLDDLRAIREEVDTLIDAVQVDIESQ